MSGKAEPLFYTSSVSTTASDAGAYTQHVDRKHRAEMLAAFGVPALGLLIYLGSLLVRWLRTALS